MAQYFMVTIMKTTTSRYMRIIAIILITILAFATVGCSFTLGSAHYDPDYIEQIVNPDRSLFYGETITVATSWPEFINRTAIMYMAANPGVRINITNYNQTITRGDYLRPFDEWIFDSVRLEIATQLMAGSAPTLIEAVLADPFDPRQSVFFYDWYLLMDADPDFVEDDWFMNAFHAFSINNQLFQLPTSFLYHPIAVNTTIPGLLEAMSDKRQGVTMSDLMELHREFSVDHPHLLEEYFTTGMLMEYYIDRFVDVETGRVDFGEEFIKLVTYAESITCPNYTRRWSTLQPYTEHQMLRKSERYLFNFYHSWFFRYWLDYDSERLFADITPLVNDRGELLLDSQFFAGYLLNANATPIQKAIAWDFMMFTMQIEENSLTILSHLMMQPPNRNVFYNIARRQLPYDYRYAAPYWFHGTEEEFIDGVIEVMTRFNEMSMRYTRVRPRVIDDIIEDAMNQFHEGLLSVEQVAELLQNQITLVLMEMSR